MEDGNGTICRDLVARDGGGQAVVRYRFDLASPELRAPMPSAFTLDLVSGRGFTYDRSARQPGKKENDGGNGTHAANRWLGGGGASERNRIACHQAPSGDSAERCHAGTD